MDLMSYKGYFARIEYSAEDHLFVGYLAGTQPALVWTHDTARRSRSARTGRHRRQTCRQERW